MLINLSHHPSSKWSEEQLQAVYEQFGRVVDLPFPVISPDNDEPYVDGLANEYFDKIESMAANCRLKPAIHLMGEMTFTFNLLSKLIKAGYECFASTTKREVLEKPDGIIESVFKFVKFRKYIMA